jgi:hypothetical protein
MLLPGHTASASVFTVRKPIKEMANSSHRSGEVVSFSVQTKILNKVQCSREVPEDRPAEAGSGSVKNNCNFIKFEITAGLASTIHRTKEDSFISVLMNRKGPSSDFEIHLHIKI